MSQVHQILSKENKNKPLYEHLAEQNAGQFIQAIVAQELKRLSEILQETALVPTTFEAIKQILRTLRVTEVSEKLQNIFSGKN